MSFFNEISESTVEHFIGGQRRTFEGEDTFDNIDPAKAVTINRVVAGGHGAVEAAVDACHEGLRQSRWSDWSVDKRATCLEKLSELILENLRDLARLESVDTGKPIAESLSGDIPRSASNLRFFAGLARSAQNRQFESVDGSVHTTVREPIGVVGLITPWNLPMYLETWKVAPALVAGNAVILKPAELTPMTALALAELAKKAGIPDGIFNVIQGFGADAVGSALVEHPDVKAISFTGETSTGVAIAQASATLLKKLSFELGGKGASVVFADAHLDLAVKNVARAAFRNQGQICLAGSRLIVEETIKDRFTEMLIEEIARIKVGDPLDEKTTMGSLISEAHKDKVMSYIDYARQQNFSILTGGAQPCHLEKGAFVEPTLIGGVHQESKLIQEEVFGPVLTIQSFSGADEALSLLNGTKYGLSCSVWTSNMKTMARMTRGARVGLLWQNSWFLRNLHTAFGGMKASGVGREGGEYSLDFFSELKTITRPNYDI